MAKPSPAPAQRPRRLVLELWGLGDLALAVPFIQAAGRDADVTVVAKPHAVPLLQRFAPAVRVLPFTAPWTAFTGKYRLHAWPWRELGRLRAVLRAEHFDVAVSARPDPRDHVLLRLSGAQRRLGFPRAGSGALLTDALDRPPRPHRAEHWAALARQLALTPSAPPARNAAAAPRRIIMHTGAGHAVRCWPLDRFDELARRLEAAGWTVVRVDDHLNDVERLLDLLGSAERFIGNDSGPGHLAALLGVPTFTIFGPQLPELFAPVHPGAGWIEGRPCPYKPCFDTCRFAEPHCLLGVTVDAAWPAVQGWLTHGAVSAIDAPRT